MICPGCGRCACCGRPAAVAVPFGTPVYPGTAAPTPYWHPTTTGPLTFGSGIAHRTMEQTMTYNFAAGTVQHSHTVEMVNT